MVEKKNRWLKFAIAMLILIFLFDLYIDYWWKARDSYWRGWRDGIESIRANPDWYDNRRPKRLWFFVDQDTVTLGFREAWWGDFRDSIVYVYLYKDSTYQFNDTLFAIVK